MTMPPGFWEAQAAYDSRLPPEYEPFYCTVGGGSSDDCDHEEECQAAEPCEYCGGVTTCRCDDMYEAAKEDRYDDWDPRDYDYGD